MKVSAFFRGLAIFLAGIFSGQAGAAAPASCNDPGSSMLWRVQGAELDSRGVTLHLFGSIHVGKREFYPLNPVIENHFRSADNLVFEVDPQVVADPQVALQMQARGTLPNGQTLADVLSPEALANLEKVMSGFGIPLSLFMNLKPWLLTLMLTSFQAEALGYNAQFGLESYFMAQKSPQSQIKELESIQQQVDMLDSLNPEIFMDYSLQEFDTNAAELEKMISAWQCGDREQLSSILFASMEAPASASAGEQAALEALNTRLFTDRNLHMADGIEQFIHTGTGSWFVVVGSGHLLGEGSVVDLLLKRGYQVEPVRLEP